jgi:hypothetical protein
MRKAFDDGVHDTVEAVVVMARPPGQEPGQPPLGLEWSDYVDWLVETHGTLAAVAERLASLRGYTDDVTSVERALRRLRSRGQLAGGTWGARALAAFGLPSPADARLRWMGAYHSRFTDMPVGFCMDLVRLWDRPPVSESPRAATWLALAHASSSLRSADDAAAKDHLRRARASLGVAPPEARAELLLVEAFMASRDDVDAVPELLAAVGPLLDEPMPAHDRACLFARWIDQRAYDLNRGRDGRGPDYAASEALYRSIPTSGAPPFVLCRRANGLAYARWRQGHADEAAALAREACRHAGDGGHVRLRAMTLSMLSRIVEGDEGAAARARADVIVAALEDESLRLRFDRLGARQMPVQR